MIKKAIAWPIAWALFWIGHAVSKLMHWDATAWLYPAYNRLMIASCDIQDWAGLSGPWKKVEGGADERG